MTVDRSTKALLTVIAIALVAIAANAWRTVLADALRPAGVEAQTPTAKYDVAVPKAWGKYVAYSNNNLLLEDKDGTLRIVDVEGKPPEYPRVKAIIRWQ